MRSRSSICSYIVLPFVNRKEEEYAVRLKSLKEENYTQVDFNVAFKAPSTIGNMFPLKDRTKDTSGQSLVVYKINCKTCVKPNTLEKMLKLKALRVINIS